MDFLRDQILCKSTQLDKFLQESSLKVRLSPCQRKEVQVPIPLHLYQCKFNDFKVMLGITTLARLKLGTILFDLQTLISLFSKTTPTSQVYYLSLTYI